MVAYDANSRRTGLSDMPIMFLREVACDASGHRHLGGHVSRARILVMLVGPALVLGACSSGGPDPDPGPTRAKEPAVAPAWSRIDVPADARPGNPVVSLAGSLPPAAGLPMLWSGSIAEPGKPARAAVWTPTSKGLGKPTILPVSSASAGAGELASDGKRTAVGGASWAKGESTPFLLTSDDRVTWEPARLPAAMTERGIFVHELAVVPDQGPVVLGLDADRRPAAVLVEAGEVVDLPAAGGKTELSHFAGLARSGERLLALASGKTADGTTRIVGYRSDDGGQTWDVVQGPAGERVSVAGLVAVQGGFVATGSAADGTDTTAAAWSSDDGGRWTREQVPDFPGHRPGWSSYLDVPAVQGNGVVVGHSDGEKLFAQVLRRSPTGRWTALGRTADWVAPGVGISVEAAGSGRLSGVRSWNGRLQVLQRDAQGVWHKLDGPKPATAPVSWWESVSLSGAEPMLVGGRTEVSIGPGGSWDRASRLSTFRIEGDRMTAAQVRPPAARELAGAQYATDDSGASVLLGVRLTGEQANGTDVVGWFRGAGASRWQPSTGLDAPRTEFLSDVRPLGQQWVAVGRDRASWTASDHAFAAVWLSEDGGRWVRQRGGFEVDEDTDTWFSASCRLPGGDLVVVGGAEDPARGEVPFAFRKAGKEWQRLDLSGLGGDVGAVRECATNDEIALVQAPSGVRDGVWSTTDGKGFTAVTVGDPEDSVGRIRSVAGGFAAPGAIDHGRSAQAVLWLSATGSTWYPVEVPVDRPMAVSDVVPWGDRVLVALTSASGPEVVVLQNPAAVLQSLAGESGDQ